MRNWIDVNIELPNEDTFNVLVAFDEPFFGHFNKECCVAYYAHETKKWHSELKGNGEILRVTHWQLLPELPQSKTN